MVSCILVVVVTNINSTDVLMMLMISIQFIVVVTNGSWFPVVLPISGAVMSSSARPLHHPVQGHRKYVSVYYYTTRWSARLLLSTATDCRRLPRKNDPQSDTGLTVTQGRVQDVPEGAPTEPTVLTKIPEKGMKVKKTGACMGGMPVGNFFVNPPLCDISYIAWIKTTEFTNNPSVGPLAGH